MEGKVVSSILGDGSMWRAHSRDGPDFNSLVVRDGHPRKGREVSIRLNLSKSFALVDMYPPLGTPGFSQLWAQNLLICSFLQSYIHSRNVYGAPAIRQIPC